MKRTLAVLLVTVALGAAGLAIVAGAALWDPATYRPARLDALPIAVIVASLLTQWVVPLFRVRFLAFVQGYRVSAWDAALAHVAMVFGSAVTPGGSGGAPALAAALARVGVPLGTSMGIAVQVAVLDLVLFAWLIPVAVVARTVSGSLQMPWQVAASGIAAVLVAVALAASIVRFPRPIVAGILALTRLRPFRRWSVRLRTLARHYYRAIRTFASLELPAWCYLQAITLTAWLASFVMLWALMGVFGHGIALLDLVSLMSVVTLVSFFVPTPGAAGYTEAAVGLAAAAAPLVWWRLGNFYLVYALAPLAALSLWRRAPAGPTRTHASHLPHTRSGAAAKAVAGAEERDDR